LIKKQSLPTGMAGSPFDRLVGHKMTLDSNRKNRSAAQHGNHNTASPKYPTEISRICSNPLATTNKKNQPTIKKG
jgi:hypothetical protein